MKYMGSKRALLDGHLGSLVREKAPREGTIFDPFCGSGVVAWFAAEHCNNAVFASDLQEYGAVLAGAVLLRTGPLPVSSFDDLWLTPARYLMDTRFYSSDALLHHKSDWNADPRGAVKRARDISTVLAADAPITGAYGGHYFSPSQALQLDALRAALPEKRPYREVALASLLFVASDCAASPGHTAQPFQPTETAGRFLFEAWRRDPFTLVIKALQGICPRYATKLGQTRVMNALDLTQYVQKNDLVILDPPYSAVQYSRFYHVFETIVRGDCGPVKGVGRYPPPTERPRSGFSQKSQSESDLDQLLKAIAERQATVILTFPAGQSSNGLSGEKVIEAAQKYFAVRQQSAQSRFSTLGGNGSANHRPARQHSEELVLLLEPC